MSAKPSETPPAHSPHFSANYAGLVLDLMKVARRLDYKELADALQIFHAEGAEELAEAGIHAAIFADRCRCRREFDRMIEAITLNIAEAVAKAQCEA